MPYIVLSANGEEIDRVELTGSTLIGRGADCDVPLRDVLLSRQHCRIERAGDGWRVCDLKSRNGTLHHGKPVSKLRLSDGVRVRIGRVSITFHAGEFVSSPLPARRHRLVRPADPHEALASTVAGMTLEDSVAGYAPSPMDDFPRPRPRPTDEVLAEQARLSDSLGGVAVAALPAARLATQRASVVRPSVRRSVHSRPHLDPADPLAAIAEAVRPTRYVSVGAVEAFRRRMKQLHTSFTWRLPQTPILAEMVVAGGTSLAVLFVGLVIQLL